MTRHILLLSISLLVSTFVSGQVFFQESFETTDGYLLSHTFDDGNNDVVKRDSSTAFPGWEFDLTGEDGIFVIGMEDTDAPEPGAPADGIVTLTFDPADISGQSDIELVIALACNAGDMPYDDRSQENGDYLDIEVNVDGSGWSNVASFCSAAGGSSISTLFHDIDMDGNGGEIGEPPVGNIMTDFVIPVGLTGNSLSIRCFAKMDGTDEELVIDDVRLRVSPGDDVPPTVNSAALLDQSTISIVFNEELGSNAESNFLYAGIPGLSNATLQADGQTVHCNYSTPFDIGQPYELVVFGVQDLAGNPMAGAFSFPFHWNPTTPELVITEVMYNDPSVEDTLEFIEIYNAGNSIAQVGGFRLEDAVEHTLSDVDIAPGGYYLVARRAESASGYYGLAFEDYQGQLSDNNEDIILRNAAGALIDSVPYNDNVPWPGLADGQGPSMELVSATADNSIGSNWVASTDNISFINGMILSASPGALNGVTLPVVQFDNNDISVVESDGFFELQFFVNASNGQANTLNLSILEATAESGDDHGLMDNFEVMLPANSTGLESIAYPVFDDMLDEGLEYIRLQMTSADNALIGENQFIDILIADDDHTSPTLFINEIQADNTATIADENAEFDDWVEIFNPNPFPVDLAGYYLSDDLTDPLQYRVPVGDASTEVPAGGYLLLWADGQNGQGALHLDFGLNAAGEEVVLSDPLGTTVVDALVFPAISADESYGRVCDGGTDLTVWATPTPLQDNCVNSTEEFKERRFFLYPNPASDVLFLSERLNYELIDAQGRTFDSGHGTEIDVRTLAPGLYLLRTEGSSLRFIKY